MFTDDTTAEKERHGRQMAMLNALHKALEVFTSYSYDENTLADVLSGGIRPIADAAGIDVVVVYRLWEERADARFGQIYRWGREGSTPIDERQRGVPHDPVTLRWISVLSGNECVSLTLGEMSEAEIAFVRPYGIRTMLLTPVFIHGELWGATLFIDLARERRLDGETVKFLRSAARLCASLIIRAEKARLAADASAARRKETERALGVLKNILNGVDIFICVTVPETGEILFLNDKIRAAYGLEGDGEGQFCYVLLEGMEARCDFCPYYRLEKEPDAVVEWEKQEDVGITVRKTARLIDWPGGKKAHLEYGMDITETARQQEMLEKVFDAIDSHVCITDLETDEILLINRAMKRDLGLDDSVRGDRCWRHLQRGGGAGRCAFCKKPRLLANPGEPITWEDSNALEGRTFYNIDRIIEWIGGRRVHMQQCIDITGMKRAQEALQVRGRMLDALNGAAIVLLSRNEGTFEDAMSEGIGLIADFADFEEMSVFRNQGRPDGLHFSQVYRWEKKAGGTTAPLEELADRPYALLLPRWEGILASNECINGPVRLMPEAGYLMPYGCLTVFVVPVFTDNRFWGFVFFEDLRRERAFSAEESDMLRSASLMLASVVIRNEEAVKMHEADERAKLMLDATPLSCVLWNRNHEVIDCNKAAVTLFGFESKEDRVRHFKKCFPEYLSDGSPAGGETNRLRDRAFEEGYCRFEWMHQMRDGTPLPAEVTLVRVKYGDDYVVAGYTRDLREHKRMMREIETQRRLLEDALSEAQAANRAKSEFLSRMSHEMRTPMSAIMGMTAIGRSASELERKDYALSKIDEASAHLLGIINDVLDISKIEAGKLDLASETFLPAEMLRKAVSLLKFRIEEKKQRFTLEIGGEASVPLSGDEQRLAQVVVNLLSNAVKFTPEGGGIALLASLTEEADGMYELRVVVSDSGIGIPLEQQKKVFLAFEQAEGGRTRKYGGTGLGLSISRRIVERMGGSIWVESREGGGSRFTFAVRLRRAEWEEPRPSEPAPPDGGGAAEGFAGKRLLLVEDVEINREILLALLEGTGLIVETAENGREALERIAEAPDAYDLVLMDVQMPEMDGLEATRRIRSLPDERCRSLPIVAMTANVYREDIESCLAAGMNGHLGKPIDIDAVFEKLREHL